VLRGKRRDGGLGDDQIDPELDQLNREVRQPGVVLLGPAVLDGEILTLDVAEIPHPLQERVLPGRLYEAACEIADPNLPGVLVGPGWTWVGAREQSEASQGEATLEELAATHANGSHGTPVEPFAPQAPQSSRAFVLGL
jgi:hypothetical protein